MNNNKDFEVVADIISSNLNPPQGWVDKKTREVCFVEPRHIACFVLYYYTNINLMDIGFYFGRISYSAISTAVATINDRMATDYSFACKIKLILSEVEKSGYVMINKDGRNKITRTGKSRVFTGIFKQKNSRPNYEAHNYVKFHKPQIKTINTIELVDVKEVDKKTSSLFSELSIPKINIFTDGVYFAEDQIRPTYKQLLDFYNSVPDNYFILTEDVAKHNNKLVY